MALRFDSNRVSGVQKNLQTGHPAARSQEPADSALVSLDADPLTPAPNSTTNHHAG